MENVNAEVGTFDQVITGTQHGTADNEIIHGKPAIAEAMVIKSQGLLTEEQARIAYDAIWNAITDKLSQGDAVRVSSFGKFSTMVRKPRESRHPGTQETITIPARRVVKFKISTALRTAVSLEE